MANAPEVSGIERPLPEIADRLSQSADKFDALMVECTAVTRMVKELLQLLIVKERQWPK